ncbi:MAG: rhomboid family intramembrane serine protease [Gammaproteobacteria bacterium]
MSIKHSQITDVVLLLASMWLVYFLQFVLPYNLSNYGIIPRTLTGLLHIPLSPWVHHSTTHLIFNSIPLLILGFIVHLSNRVQFWEVTVLIIILSGLGTWLIGSSGLHGGASGLITGYWSFILVNALFLRSVKSIFLALITLFLYGGMFFILLDVRPQISWAGHASGFIAGALTVWIKFKVKPRSR